MKNRFFTIIVIPEKSSAVKKIVIPRLTLQVLSIVSIILLVVLTIVILDYQSLLKKVLQAQNIYNENLILKQNYEKVRSRMSSIESTVDRMKTFSTKLRTIVNIPTDEAHEKKPINSQPELVENETVDTVLTGITSLEDRLLGKEHYLQRTYELLQDKTEILQRTPSILPARGWIASTFGYRFHPFHGRWLMHEGVDIAGYIGSKVVATADGIVTFSGDKGAFGKMVVIDHGYGVTTLYAHNNQLFVQGGQSVRRGQAIAALGSTGMSSGPHVHYEVRINDVPVDPMNYVLTDLSYRTITNEM